MPALVAGIHVFAVAQERKAWMAGPSPAMTKEKSLRLEIHRDAVDAVAQVRRRRAVVEYVAEMAAAAAAIYLGAHHAVAAIDRGLDRARLRIVEARPAGAAVEFSLRHEQRLPAPGARERAGAFLIIERAASRGLGAVLAHHLVLFRREQAAPLLVGVGDRVLLFGHGRSSRVAVEQLDRDALRRAQEGDANARPHRGGIARELDALQIGRAHV